MAVSMREYLEKVNNPNRLKKLREFDNDDDWGEDPASYDGMYDDFRNGLSLPIQRIMVEHKDISLKTRCKCLLDALRYLLSVEYEVELNMDLEDAVEC